MEFERYIKNHKKLIYLLAAGIIYESSQFVEFPATGSVPPTIEDYHTYRAGDLV